MTGKAPLSESQRALLEFLHVKAGTQVTVDQILSATKWKPATWKSYWSKGVLAPFFIGKPDGTLQVQHVEDLDDWSFLRQVTQTASAREVGAPCNSSLARALLRKARDNMTLALELFNRPSLENRLDAFCMLFCTAWEQLLKAGIMETSGDEAVFRPKVPGRRQETISLDEAMDKAFSANDPVRANIARIAELRHGATHLLMPEVQGVLSRLFQAGVLNFTRSFLPLAGQPLFASSASGLLSLVNDVAAVDVISLRQTYGDRLAGDISELIAGLEASIEKTNDERYAISVEYKLVLTKATGRGDIKLSAGSDAAQTLQVVEKPVNFTSVYPFRPTALTDEVAKASGSQVNLHDIQSVVFVEKWKSSNNEYHFEQPQLGYHWYSQRAVDFLAAKIRNDPTYVPRARDSFAHHQRTIQQVRKESRRRAVPAPPAKSRGND